MTSSLTISKTVASTDQERNTSSDSAARPGATIKIRSKGREPTVSLEEHEALISMGMGIVHRHIRMLRIQ